MVATAVAVAIMISEAATENVWNCALDLVQWGVGQDGLERGVAARKLGFLIKIYLIMVLRGQCLQGQIKYLPAKWGPIKSESLFPFATLYF